MKQIIEILNEVFMCGYQQGDTGLITPLEQKPIIKMVLKECAGALNVQGVRYE